MQLDYSKITRVQVADIDHKDAPDYCDAFIESALYEGRPMTDDEMELLNSDSNFVYKAVMEHIY